MEKNRRAPHCPHSQIKILTYSHTQDLSTIVFFFLFVILRIVSAPMLGKRNSMDSSGITREQKIGVALLVIFGFTAIGLGFLQMHNTIYGPFVLRRVESTDPLSLFADEKTRLQQVDTDHDSLNDFEELEFYTTSPYLPDTDSDGLTDKEEIDGGSDPLCPRESDCAVAEDIGAKETSPLLPGEAPEEVDIAELFADAATEVKPASEAGVIDIATVARDPAALRKLLRDSGKMTEAELGRIDDATLLSIAAQLVADQSKAQ